MRIVPQHWKQGGSYGICQRCGFKYRLNDLRLEWTGLRVCPDDWDERPPQLTPPNVFPEGLPRPDCAPEPPDVFVSARVTVADL